MFPEETPGRLQSELSDTLEKSMNVCVRNNFVYIIIIIMTLCIIIIMYIAIESLICNQPNPQMHHKIGREMSVKLYVENIIDTFTKISYP